MMQDDTIIFSPPSVAGLIVRRMSPSLEPPVGWARVDQSAAKRILVLGKPGRSSRQKISTKFLGKCISKGNVAALAQRPVCLLIYSNSCSYCFLHIYILSFPSVFLSFWIYVIVYFPLSPEDTLVKSIYTLGIVQEIILEYVVHIQAVRGFTYSG